MSRPSLAYTCSYTPLPLLHAAGFTPRRLLPMSAVPERAGTLLHDNVCPLVKRLLDRALADELPALAGIVVMSSCETMRRFADAWRVVKPELPVLLVDLPLASTPLALEHFAGELRALARWLEALGGRRLEQRELVQSIEQYNALAAKLAAVARDQRGAGLQELRLRSASLPVEEVLAAAPAAPEPRPAGVPVLLTGNMLPDPEAFALLEQCGLEVVADDLCTGSRQHTPCALRPGDDAMTSLARALLERPPCARMLDPKRPGELGRRVATEARTAGARGVVAHVLKFCDPYLGRLPELREALRQAGLPLLVLEGDCTLRSLGQYRTRLEAFAETLGEV